MSSHSTRKPIRKTKTKTKTRKIRKSRKLIGGKPIGSGGYGCIFKPALKCKGVKQRKSESESDRKVEDKITKLMIKKYAKKEYDDIQKFIPFLKRIPNYEKYFLVSDVSICQPDNLDEDDLEDFDKKCKNLVKKEITASNINEKEKLALLGAVNMPYGGIDVDDYIQQSVKYGYLDYKKMAVLNEKMINLLKHGILPMNAEHIYHCDLKAANMLVDEQLDIRVIDWGLSCKYYSGPSVPTVLQRRSFQYNLPFSNILFSDRFYQLYKKFLTEKKAPSYLETRDFVVDFVFLWIKERGPGHLKAINNIVALLFGDSLEGIEPEFKDQLLEFNYTFHFILEYISKVLMKFTKDGEFDKIAYLKVFLKNIDIWGFTISYITMIEVIDELDNKSGIDLEIIEKIKEAIVLCYESSDIEINVGKLIELLEQLTTILRKGSTSRSSSLKDGSNSGKGAKGVKGVKNKKILKNWKNGNNKTKKIGKYNKKNQDKEDKEDKEDKQKRKPKFSLIRELYRRHSKK